MSRFKDLTGLTFNNLKVLSYFGKSVQPSGKWKSLWTAECSCGVVKTYTSDSLTTSKVKSCGCMKSLLISDKKITHNKSKTPLYKIYKQMLFRCYNKKDVGYKYYGAIGVVVCDRWLCPINGLYNFIEDMGERPDSMSLNRVKGALLYSKETCEWASLSMQAFDQRKRKTNTSGSTGVRQIPSSLWVAEIDCKGREYLGSFPTKEEAIEARKSAEIRLFGWSKS